MKPPLLLLHGALGSAQQFSSFEKQLDADFEILKLDFSGHGKQDWYPSKLSIELFTQDVLAFLAQANLPKTNIFGYSMGGFVALNLALTHPEKVDKIFTLATKFNWTPESAVHEVKFLVPDKMKEKVPAFATHLKNLHGSKWEELVLQTAALMLALGDKNVLPISELSKIKKRVLLGLGDQDKMVSLAETQAVQEALSNSSFQLFANTPHPWEQVNQAQLAVELLQFFMGEQSRTE